MVKTVNNSICDYDNSINELWSQCALWLYLVTVVCGSLRNNLWCEVCMIRLSVCQISMPWEKSCDRIPNLMISLSMLLIILSYHPTWFNCIQSFQHSGKLSHFLPLCISVFENIFNHTVISKKRLPSRWLSFLPRFFQGRWSHFHVESDFVKFWNYESFYLFFICYRNNHTYLFIVVCLHQK